MLNATTPEQALETLFFEACEREGALFTQSKFSRWMRNGTRKMRDAVGTTVRVRSRESNAQRKVYITGTIASVVPAYLKHHNRSMVVVWRVQLETGRTVHLTRI